VGGHVSVDLAKYAPSKRGPQCSVGRFLDTADPETVEDFWTLIRHPDVTYAAMQTHAPDDLGVRLNADTISRHVRGLCSCDD